MVADTYCKALRYHVLVPLFMNKFAGSNNVGTQNLALNYTAKKVPRFCDVNNFLSG